MSYFAKPNFIIYDEWFDEDYEKTKFDFKNKKLKKISSIHEFFYEKSNHKTGSSENNLELNLNVNVKEKITNYFSNNAVKYTSISNKKFKFFEKYTNSSLKFYPTKKLIYSFTIISLAFILGFSIFYISSSKKSESNISTRFLNLEKEF